MGYRENRSEAEMANGNPRATLRIWEFVPLAAVEEVPGFLFALAGDGHDGVLESVGGRACHLLVPAYPCDRRAAG